MALSCLDNNFRAAHPWSPLELTADMAFLDKKQLKPLCLGRHASLEVLREISNTALASSCTFTLFSTPSKFLCRPVVLPQQKLYRPSPEAFGEPTDPWSSARGSSFVFDSGCRLCKPASVYVATAKFLVSDACPPLTEMIQGMV